MNSRELSAYFKTIKQSVDDFDDLPEMTPLQNLEQKPGAKAAPKPAPKPERGTYDYGKSNNGTEMQKTMRNIKY